MPDDEFMRGAVTIRMYRDILGDCFLLRFPGATATFNVLIDSGILQGMPGAKERARRIMSDVASLAPRIDLLVITHEHVDHLSCFHQARDIFDRLDIGELWLAWTEDPRDEQAAKLRTGRAQAMALLERSHSALAALMSSEPSTDDDDEAPTEGRSNGLEALKGLMAFSGRDPSQPPAAPGGSTGEILAYLRGKAKRVTYLQPGGAPRAFNGVADLSVYVLGPPKVEALLKRSNPHRHSSEVYELDAETIQDDLFLVAALNATSDASELDVDDIAKLRLSLPFGFKNLIATEPRSRSFGAPADDSAWTKFEALYGRRDDEWRRIDTDWLGATEQLALKLDSDTNNTSLVLAFRLGDGADGRVLLFPGDAQVGNWLSWHEHVWPPMAKKGEPGTVTAEDLLAMTVLYKVGHHASHNATLREGGLESMTHRDLVAMVPVHQEFANGTKRWNMPFPSLLQRLEQKTGGRVIRADKGKMELEVAAKQYAGQAGGLEAGELQRFLSCVREITDPDGPLAMEYRIPWPGATDSNP
ncbi:hypothetical protein P7D22_14795 [Lichenihabitans sp. Uapishka_5]|uniref:MBL fold metallo-hydrolase n=1 Tax=Lichenihabitans sp. Uapishka_5 TaxID=3037302 RepID=UPI0029E7F23A|nr:MBL fold metallo-hydrolase [Lichenihabitans sp. Uapishka_5]MDX7952436.1 hypothetical protein [Lichenihabitans sp. Uapishka_5]